MLKSIVKKSRIVALVMVAALFCGLMAPAQNVSAAAYGDKLTLNTHKIKMNGTTKFTAQGRYASYNGEEEFANIGLFSSIKYSDITTTIKTKKTKSGNKNKVKFTVTYKLDEDPQIDCKDRYLEEEGDWYTCLTRPNFYYTVFDYKTGKSIETGSDKVTVKSDEGQWEYYPDQSYSVRMEDGSIQTETYQNVKSYKRTFTVTYPRKYKDAVVGIGFVNVMQGDTWEGTDNYNYWNGTVKYGKTNWYKIAKKEKTAAYIRLK